MMSRDEAQTFYDQMTLNINNSNEIVNLYPLNKYPYTNFQHVLSSLALIPHDN